VASTLTIGPRERDVLHALMCRRLFVLGQDPPALARREGIGTDQLADEFAEDMRLMEDIGWEFEDARGAVELTMPEADLAATIRRLRRDARRAPSEGRRDGEPEEAEEERWERFRAAVDVCEELLELLDSPSLVEDDDAGGGVARRDGPAGDDDLKSYTRPSGALALAAVERAQRHERAAEVGAQAVAEHLGFTPTPHTAGQLRPLLENLRRHGWLARRQERGRDYWSLTDAGRAIAGCPAESEVLPESPQHRAWRRAREAAAVRIDGFRREVLDAAEEAEGLGGGAALPRSAEIFALAERLRWAAWRLGSAAHCLYEWVEPDDAFPDVDESPGPSPGRRAVSAWDAGSGGLPGSR
jgi:hypothetical protein